MEGVYGSEVVRLLDQVVKGQVRMEKVLDDLRDEQVKMMNMLIAQPPQGAHKPAVTVESAGGASIAEQSLSVGEVCDWINRWTPKMEAYTLTDVKKELKQMGCVLPAVTGKSHTLIRRALMQCGWIPPTMPTRIPRGNGRWWFPPQIDK